MKLTRQFSEFIQSEQTQGLVLVFATIASLLLANSSIQVDYIGMWHTDLGSHSAIHWINDGLMAIFFLHIGLELVREINIGELSNFKKASLPVTGALGGITVPALIYLAFNYGTPTQSGVGIPMATDIAFAVGILAILKNRVPTALKIFLIALAVIDDLVAILMIAVFYTKSLSWDNLFISLGIFAVLIVLNRLKVKNILIYLIGGVAMWYFMLHSGVHATITGILLATVIPFNHGTEESSFHKLQHALHMPVAFVILPLFAMANTCIAISADWQEGLTHSNSLGIIAGLVLGKPIGIFLFAVLGASIGWCTLPTRVAWKHILSVGFLGGIGFTMSIFITLLAFNDHEIIDGSKMAILLASTIAGILGIIMLRLTTRDYVEIDDDSSEEMV